MLLMNFMNCMKKHLRINVKLILLAMLFVVSLVTIIISILRSKKIYHFLTYQKEYYLMENNPSFNVNIYSTNIKDNYLYKDNIKSIILSDELEDNYYEITLNNIVDNKESISYEDKLFKKHTLNLTFPITNGESFQIHNAKLKLNFTSNEVIDIPIGSVILNQNEYDNEINITKLKGTVNIIDNIPVLTGIGITVDANQSIKITSIRSLDDRIEIDLNDTFNLSDSNYPNDIKLSELKENVYGYEPCSLPIELETSKHIFLPFKYQNIVTIKTVGFIIEYEKGINKYYQLISPFQFFNSSIESIEVVTYEANNY